MALGLTTERQRDVARQQVASESLLQKLNAFDRAIDAHWSRWYPKAREWYAIHAGDQWDADAKMELIARGLNPISMNRVDAMISAISGAEITNRQTVRYAPREAGDVVINELYTGAVEWARDQCDANDEESQAFRDTLICGMGVIENRMDYLEDIEGMAKVERHDPLEFGLDPAAAKSNFVDANYLRRKRRITSEDKRKRFPRLCLDGAYGGIAAMAQHRAAAPGQAYAQSRVDDWSDAPLQADEEEIIEYQWREVETAALVVDPSNGSKVRLSREDIDRWAQLGVDIVAELNGIEIMQWSWWRAFRSGDHCIKEKLPDEEFTYKFVTGKIDRNSRLPYGAVRAMVDPQRWANKFLAQIDFIISANAKGGILYEADAFEDQREAEENWASGASMIAVTSGALARGKIQNKPVPPYPQGLDRLFQIASAALPEVVGVNREMLGIADQAQAGVLEYQRKQAAYGVLSVFFDSMRRYRKLGGRHFLKLIAKYMSDGRLIRITNPTTSQQQYVPLIRDPNALKFDIIVDEAPQGPNQKERVWQMLMGLGQVMQSLQGLPPDMILAVMEYSPLPSSLIDKLREMLSKAQNDPNAQAQQQMQQQLQIAGWQATVQKLQGEAAEAAARAQKTLAEAQAVPQRTAFEGQKVQIDYTRMVADTGLKLRQIEDGRAARAESRDDARMAREEDRNDAMRSFNAPTGARGTGRTPNADQALLYVLSGVAQSMDKVGEALAAPQEIVRDEFGRVAGSRKAMPQQAQPLTPTQPPPSAPALSGEPALA